MKFKSRWCAKQQYRWSRFPGITGLYLYIVDIKIGDNEEYYFTTMEVYVVWGVSSPLIGELNCRNVIVQKSCFVEAQPSSKCSKYSVRMGVGIIRRYICHISLCCLKVHTSDNFVDIQDCGMILSRFQTWETCSFESSCSPASVTRACLVYNCYMIILFQIRSTLHVLIVTA